MQIMIDNNLFTYYQNIMMQLSVAKLSIQHFTLNLFNLYLYFYILMQIMNEILSFTSHQTIMMQLSFAKLSYPIINL